MPATGADGSGMAMRIAIYDLDRTLTRKPTFTPFLHFAAWRIAPWRIVFSPVWIAAMILYRIGLYNRTTLKTFGMRMMLGRPSMEQLAVVGREFARHRIAHSGLMPGALRLLAEDQAANARILIATAAFDFYARAFAEELSIAEVIGTRWDGRTIPGGNCYGPVKKQRVLDWMAAEGMDRDAATIRFVSDSFADTPLLDYSDDPIFATGSERQAVKARALGWRAMDLST